MKGRALLLASFTAALAGCPGSLEDPARFDGYFEGGACPDTPAFFATTCATTTCHTASDPAGSLDLASKGLPERLAGKKATGGEGLLIDATTPEASLLYTKLVDPAPFGSRMPLLQAPLDDATLGCVLTWLEDSAKGTP